MKDDTKYILDKLDSYANGLTGFIAVQALIFCYALGNASMLQAFRDIAPVRWATAGTMGAVLIAVVLILLRLRRQAAHLIGEEPHMRPILRAFWVRIGAVVLYGTLPLVLLLVLC